MSKHLDPNVQPSVDRTSQAFEALKAGSSTVDSSAFEEEDTESGIVEDNGLDSLFGTEGSTANQSSDDEGSLSDETGDSTSESTTSKDVEELIVKGSDGKRKKIKVDYSDRQQIKQNALKAAGMRKFQAERDAALREVDQLRSYEEKASNFDLLSEAFEVGGPEAVIRAMLGEEDSRKWLESFAEKVAYRQSATDEELKYLDAQEKAEQRERELQLLKKRQEEYENRVTQKQEAAEVAELQATVNSVFEKYRFAGTLGDSTEEYELDQMVWTRAKNQLQAWEDEGLPITRERAERAFKRASERLRKVIGKQSTKKANSKINQTKEKALEAAQVTAKRGTASNKKADEARDMIRKGNIAGFFKSFGSNVKF